MKKWLFLTIIFLSFIFQSFADETDNFTYSKIELIDSSQIINEKFNYYLQKGIDDANLLNKGNDKKVLYKSLKKYITDKTSDESIITDLYKDKNLDIISIKKSESIYKNWTLREGLSLGKKNTFIGSVVNFNGVQIGVDKLEHMFRTGRILFGALDRGWEFDNVLKLSYFMERWLLGGNRIGASIISYGDLSANFNGIRLWNDLLGNYPDPLGREISHYIVFEENLWYLQNEVDLKNYIDESFDERINSSTFSHKSSTEKFAENVEEAKEEGLVENVGYSENKEVMDNLILKYGEYSENVINKN